MAWNAFESERRNASSKERGKAKGNHRQLMLILFPLWICFPGTHVATAVAVGAKNAAQTACRLPPPDPLDLLSRAAGRQRRVSEVKFKRNQVIPLLISMNRRVKKEKPNSTVTRELRGCRSEKRRPSCERGRVLLAIDRSSRVSRAA